MRRVAPALDERDFEFRRAAKNGLEARASKRTPCVFPGPAPTSICC